MRPFLDIDYKYEPLKPGQFIKGSEYHSICIHHTAGGTTPSTIQWWNTTKDRVATPFIIDRDGTIYQVFPLSFWAYHLYVASPGNKVPKKYKHSRYDKHILGIELANWGQLTKQNDKFYNYVGREVKNVEEVKYRGYQYWEPYSQAQIKSLENLLKILTKELNIKPKENYKDIFDINMDALNMVPGIYTHTSYRTDKVDCFLSPSLLMMLNNLE